MHEEAGFLSVIRQSPADNTARLVFADWLDEQDDPNCKIKADFIRLELRVALAPQVSLNRLRWGNQLKKLATNLDPAWLAVISRPKLEACRLQFQFECPKQWGRLNPTSDEKVRFCASCKKHVHYCDTIQEAQTHATQGNCVAVSLQVIRRPHDLSPQEVTTEPTHLSSEMAERLRSASIRGMRIGIALPDAAGNSPTSQPEVRPPLPILHWVPEPESEARHAERTRRRLNRNRRRSIERENWEETD